MERRDFMTSVGSLMALGTLSTPLVGHATTGGLTPGDLSEEGLDAYMDEVSAQIRRIEATRVQPEIKRHLRQRGMPARMPKDIARAMLVSSAVRDLPPALQEHAKVQRRLRREGPRLTRTAMRLTDFVKGHTEEELRDIQKRFQEDPSLGEEAISHYTRWGDRHGLPKERKEQTRSFMESATWQLTHQPPSLALSECTDKVDRACASAGFRQEDWEAHLGVVEDDPDSGWVALPGADAVTQAGRSANQQIGRGVGFIALGALVFGLGSLVAWEVSLMLGVGGCVVGGIMAFYGLMLILGGLIQEAQE